MAGNKKRSKVATERTDPPLLALLICEKVILDDRGVPTLVNVVDTFSFERIVPKELLEQLPELSDIPVPVSCVVFAKWGPGQGEFSEELRVIKPNGEELARTKEVNFKIAGGFHFYQIRHQITLPVRESGIYRFEIYLNGKYKGVHSFQVHISSKPQLG